MVPCFSIQLELTSGESIDFPIHCLFQKKNCTESHRGLSILLICDLSATFLTIQPEVLLLDVCVSS